MLKHLITRCMVGATVLLFSFIVTLAFAPGALVSDANAQTRASQEKEKPARAKAQMRMQVGTTDLSKLANFCNPQQSTSTRSGNRTTYTCKPNPGGGTLGLQANPDVAKATINCNYSDNNGTMTWLGCECTGDSNGDCIGFINNCLEGGDDVSGNSGSASCSPAGE